MRIVFLGLLLCVHAWGAPESSVAAVTSTEHNATALPARTVEMVNDEIGYVDEQIQADRGAWRKAIEAYIEHTLLSNSQTIVSQRLENSAGITDATQKKALKELQRKNALALKQIDPKLVSDVEYYLHPHGENLSVHSTMYGRYETRGGQLAVLQDLVSQKQKLLIELARSNKEDKTVQERLRRTKLTLETINKVQARLGQLSDRRLTMINDLNRRMTDLDDDLEQNNIWQKSYNAYLTYVDVKKNLAALQKQIETLSASKEVVQGDGELDALKAKQKILTDQMALLQSHGSSPFAELVKPEEIERAPEITNPLDIFSGFSYVKKIDKQLKEYRRRAVELKNYLQQLVIKRQLYSRLSFVESDEIHEQRMAELDAMIEKFQIAYTTMNETEDVYAKRIEEVELKINQSIEEQLAKLAKIGGIISFLLIFFFIMKQIAKKYISDNERFYMANKVITFANVTLIILVLLFNYIENVSYVVTVLGFASAGIAIAMKDWFMSMLGWMVIVFGGSIHVGDRIRVDMDGVTYVGDVLDVSMLRITLLEDITLTTYLENRRAGRVIFVPNNFVFTKMIANYTHVSLKTVWDGIDITITFDSNHKKAQQIAKEVTRKFAKGYTDITRNQLNKLRSRYNLKNTNVDPRIYAMAEGSGICITCWYLTNAYATLTLRSTISMEILDAYAKEDDITIAYPTQRLRVQQEPLPQPSGKMVGREPV